MGPVLHQQPAAGLLSADLLITGGAVLVMDQDGAVHHDGAVAVTGGRIAAVGPAAEVSEAVRGARRTIDAGGHAVLPGLVDLHCHTAVERGGHTESLDLWTALTRHWYPMMRGLDPETVRLAARAFYVELLRTGTTTANDMFRHLPACAEAAAEVGIRVTLANLVARPEDGLDGLDDAAAAHGALHGAAGGRVSVAVGLEWLPLADRGLLRAAGDLARELGCGLHLHLSESPGEVDACRERYGARPVAVAEECGLLGPHTVAAHCVWLTDEEITVIARSGAHVAHNPVANAKMAEGVARLPDLVAAGVNVGLGHDSTEGNNSSDMFEVMKWAALLQRATRLTPDVVGAPDVLRMATANGARALGTGAGVLAEGRPADLIVVDARPDLFDPDLPVNRANLASRLAFSTTGARVRTVVVDGRVVIDDGRLTTADEDDVMAGARRAQAAVGGITA